MVQIKNQIDEIDRQLAAEIQTIKASLKAAYESSLAQEEEMKKRVETLSRRFSICRNGAYNTTS